jgi:hypothetical protein
MQKSRPLGAVGIVAVACSLVLLAGNAVSGQSQDSRVAQILEKAGAYVGSFERQLAGVVAEETYVQQQYVITQRTLKSDLLLVPVPGEARYVEFRDVFEVDGRAVRDREDRLTRLFLDPSASASAQLRAISEESARYNLGNIQRTVNIPTLALVFLRAENQHALTFGLTTRTTPGLQRFDLATSAQEKAFAGPAGTVVVTFKEASHNTLIRDANNRDVPANGRFWLDPATGGVVMSELMADDSAIRGTIDVRYRPEASIGGQMLPSEMREYYGAFGKPPILGRATYDHFRTFQVQTSTGDVQVK